MCNLILNKNLLFVFCFSAVFGSSTPAGAASTSLESTLKGFLAARCEASFDAPTAEMVNSVTRPVAPGLEDVIYTIQYSSDLTIKVVNRAEGDWYVFGGSGDVCDFSGLQVYSE